MSTAVSLKASPTEQATSAQRVPVNGPLDRIRQIGDAIAHRAYELFQKRGRASGCDQEDWYGAERELLHALHYTIFETDSALMTFAEVPRFHADNLMVSVEPRRITGAGQRDTSGQGSRRKVFCVEGCADQVFPAVTLPAEVDPLKTSARLRDGILELVIPRHCRRSDPRMSSNRISSCVQKTTNGGRTHTCSCWRVVDRFAVADLGQFSNRDHRTKIKYWQKEARWYAVLLLE